MSSFFGELPSEVTLGRSVGKSVIEGETERETARQICAALAASPAVGGDRWKEVAGCLCSPWGTRKGAQNKPVEVVWGSDYDVTWKSPCGGVLYPGHVHMGGDPEPGEVITFPVWLGNTSGSPGKTWLETGSS